MCVLLIYIQNMWSTINKDKIVNLQFYHVRDFLTHSSYTLMNQEIYWDYEEYEKKQFR